jgi:hypothetical protein
MFVKNSATITKTTIAVIDRSKKFALRTVSSLNLSNTQQKVDKESGKGIALRRLAG